MASPTPKPSSKPLPPAPRPTTNVPCGKSTSWNLAKDGPREVVDPFWLLKALGVVIIAALICGYLTLCFLFYQGQWQLVLHPSRTIPVPATIDGASYETIHFGVDETGTPQLVGWWLPAGAGAKYASHTILYLPSGDGSLAAAAPTLSALHEIGINVFAFDYRGYGQSAATHPNQRRMTEDASSAWQYLTVSRAMPPTGIVLFGDGVGGALAVDLTASHPEAPAVILQSLRPDIVQVALADARTKPLPVHLLFHDRFEISLPLTSLRTPKLLILADPATPQVQQASTAAVEPKMVSTMPSATFNGLIYREQIARFLDQYLR